MKLLGNTSAVLCTLLALAAVGSSLPITIDVTAEDFMNMKEIKVRSDGTPINQTGSEDMVRRSGISTYSYTLVGDGNPHQNFVITQKGGTLVACDTPGSNTGTGYSVTIGWSLSLGINSEFSSAGFSVEESQSWSVQQQFDCNGVADEGGEICVIFYQAVTAFTVDVTESIVCPCPGGHCTGCEGGGYIGTAIVYAPNANQIGSIPGRGINVVQHGVQQCFGDTDRTINYYCGPPGGPEWWNGRGDGPWIADYVNQREPPGCAIPIEANRYTD